MVNASISAMGLSRRVGTPSAIRSARREMSEAQSYAEWTEAAKQYDQSTGAALWKAKDPSPDYDHALIRQRLDEFVRLRAIGDDERLLFALNEGIHGDLGGMGRAHLYKRAAFGTKHLITDYVDAVVEALEHLATETRSGIPPEAKQDFFRRASLCYGHTALMLSGSGTLFFFHVGVLRALLSEELLPSILSGSSGGAMVAAILGTRAPDEQIAAMDVETFRHFLGNGSIIPSSIRRKVIEQKTTIMAEMFPDLTFEEAFARSGLSINVSVAPTDVHQRSRLLNAITSPHVCVREAVLASGALPGIFPAVTLMAKTADGDRQPYLPEHRWVDGSLSDDLPAKRLARLFGVNHYIVSQTNPHVLPFITDAKGDGRRLSLLWRTGQRTLRELFNGTASMMLPALKFSPGLTRASMTFLSIINQDYLGNINILPPPPPPSPIRLLSFRTEQEARELIRSGEKATWPYIEMIRTQTKISRTLDRILGQALPLSRRAPAWPAA